MDTTSVKFDLMNDTTKILMEKQERIEGQVNSWETKLRKMEMYKYMDEWRRRIKVLILEIEEFPQQSHFDALKVTEDVQRMKMEVNNSSWRIESVRRLGKKRGGRPILVRFISFTNKLKVFQATRNLVGTGNTNKTKLQHQGKGNTQATDFIFKRCQTTGKHSTLSKRQIGDKQKSM